MKLEEEKIERILDGEEKWNGSARKFFSSSSIVGDLSIWDYNSNCVFYEERRNERVELKG